MRCQSAALKTSSIELSAMSYENVKKPKNRKRKSSMRSRKWFAMELSLSKTQWLTFVFQGTDFGEVTLVRKTKKHPAGCFSSKLCLLSSSNLELVTTALPPIP